MVSLSLSSFHLGSRLLDLCWILGTHDPCAFGQVNSVSRYFGCRGHLDESSRKTNGFEPRTYLTNLSLLRWETRGSGAMYVAGLAESDATGPRPESFGSHVGGRQAPVDQERRSRHVGRLVAGQIQRSLRDLPGLRETTHRQMD